jgi:hypothetical protein
MIVKGVSDSSACRAPSASPYHRGPRPSRLAAQRGEGFFGRFRPVA